MPNFSKQQQDLENLIQDGEKLKTELQNQNPEYFIDNYQIWYSESLELIRNILPKRLDDFEEYFSNKKMQIYEGSNKFSIKNCLNAELKIKQGSSAFNYDYLSPTIKNLTQQVAILKACQKKFTSSLFEIKLTLQAELFDSELEQAQHLNELGFFRAAGAIAGVVLEGHLAQVCQKYDLNLAKNSKGKEKTGSIANYNQLLKDSEIIEIDIFRKIQYLADLRNMCDHSKEVEPTKENIEELITGTDKIIKNLS